MVSSNMDEHFDKNAGAIEGVVCCRSVKIAEKLSLSMTKLLEKDEFLKWNFLAFIILQLGVGSIEQRLLFWSLSAKTR